MTKNNEVIAENPFPNSGVTRRLSTLGRLWLMLIVSFKTAFRCRGSATWRHVKLNAVLSSEDGLFQSTALPLVIASGPWRSLLHLLPSPHAQLLHTLYYITFSYAQSRN